VRADQPTSNYIKAATPCLCKCVVLSPDRQASVHK